MRKNNRYVKPCAFSSMSPSKRRVAIAKDVIAGLKSKRLIAVHGIFIDANVEMREFATGKEVQLQKVLAKNMTSCEVCAKGAIFIAMVEKFNRIRIISNEEYDDALWIYNDDRQICEALRGVFSEDQAHLIETAFECRQISTMTNTQNETTEAAISLGQAYKGAEERLIAIMKNIIKNDGTFKP